jgi:PilZ domain
MKTDILNENQRLKSSTRRSPRLRLQVPVFIRGIDVSGADFVELTKTVNISANGACITCVHVLRPEQIIHLTIPTPPPASSSLVPSETPPIRAKVLRHSAIGDMRLIGLDFLRPLE